MVRLAREVVYVSQIVSKGTFFLAADIGGTNSNFGVFSLEHDNVLLLVSLHYKSKEISDFTLLVKQVLDYIQARYAITITHSCIGAAGIVYPHRVYVKPTHLSFAINLNDILKASGLKEIFLINDFEAVALGLELVDPKSIIYLNKGTERVRANRGFIGAGTGLGASSLLWDTLANRYLPVPSEAGHTDAALYTMQEYALFDLIRQSYSVRALSWEHILSGTGIQKIYHSLGVQKEYKVTDIKQEIADTGFDPDKISYYASQDQQCADTFLFYSILYARFAKNQALQVLSLDGMYIAGGIAAKNVSLFFNPLFLKEFICCNKHQEQLSQITVAILSDYNVSLYGAVVAAQLRRQGFL
jgi:glucokinase